MEVGLATSTVNAIGAAWISLFLWYLIFLTEMLLLFIPIYLFACGIAKLIHRV